MRPRRVSATQPGPASSQRDRARVSGIRRHPAWAAAPLICVFLVAYLYPLARMLGDALLTPDLWSNLSRLWEVPLYSRVLVRTMWIAALVAVVTTAIAYPLAAFISSRPPRQRGVLLALLFLPLLTSVVVRTYVWVTILRPGGLLDWMSHVLGLPALDGAVYQNEIAVLIGMLQLMVPFAAVPLFAGFRALDPDLRRAAASLGARRSRQWRHVLLPLTAPAILAAVVLVFVTTLGFVVTPQILGGPRGVTLGVLVSRQVAANDLPLGSLLAALLLITTVGILALSRAAVAVFRHRGLI